MGARRSTHSWLRRSPRTPEPGTFILWLAPRSRMARSNHWEETLPLPEVFKTDDVAGHLGVSRDLVDREAHRLGCYVQAGRHMLFTADDVRALLSAWHPVPQVSRLGSIAPSGLSE